MAWLFDRTSLTARLVRHCRLRHGTGFRVEVLRQRIAAPTADERQVLKLRARHHAIIREVKLYCGERAMVYARTVIPLTTVTGAQRIYANTGSRPLGAMLFADKSMRRGEVTVSCLQPGDRLYPNTAADGQGVWGRRSVFRVGGKPLLVSEYFLPAIYR